MPSAPGLSVETPTKRLYRSDRQVQREANILEVTRQALAAKGYDGVTMNALAEQAGVTKRTLYNLYGGKDELLHAAVGEVIARYRGDDVNLEPGIPTILASRKTAIAEVVATPAYSDAMTRALVQTPAEHPLTKALLSDSITFTTQHLQVAEGNQELNPGTCPENLARQIVSQGWGMVLLRMKGLLGAEEFRSGSLQGLLMLLTGATQGTRRDRLSTELNQLI